MKRFILVLAWLILTAVFGASARAVESSVAGEWVGEYQTEGNYTPIRARFDLDRTAVKATLEFLQREASGVALEQVRFSSPNLHFGLPRSAGPILFNGQLSGGVIRGTIQSADERGTFHLVHADLVIICRLYVELLALHG